MPCRSYCASLAFFALIASASGAAATMPALSPQPSDASYEACRNWAQRQNAEALQMWGQLPDGSSRREIAAMRLTLLCLGDPRSDIVAFGSSARSAEAYCVGHPDAAICKPKASARSSAMIGFVFSSLGAVNGAKAAEGISISEKVAPRFLKRRFPGYAVRVAKGEDCLICATVTGEAGSLEVSYGDDERTVTGLSTHDEKASDTLGNRSGGSLIAAVGPTALCDNGLEFTCASSKIKGLSYIVAEDEKCRFDVGDGAKPVAVPACAKIEGFSLSATVRGR